MQTFAAKKSRTQKRIITINDSRRCNILGCQVLLCLMIANDRLLSVTGCTTIGVGKLASSDGSVFCSHSNDGEGETDPRLVMIPRADWPANSSRPIFYSPEDYPRYVGTERGDIDAYKPPNDDDDDDDGKGAFERICEIPQVPHTYQYFEETYGALNERQLGIAESTCSGVFGAAPKGVYYDGYGVGKACFSVDALTQIAMERHSKARDAIREMGSLAEKHGFYGAGLFEGTSESLIVTDANEVWVFHILPDPTGSSAIWAAQKVPDDHVAVVPNVFIIRDINPDDTETFLYSQSVYDVATELGWYQETDNNTGKKNFLDFTATYSDGEYAHKYYSGRRAWGVYNLFAPSLNLPAEYEEWRMSNPYPFSAKPDHKISLKDIAQAMGYFYQGTKYAQTEVLPSNAETDTIIHENRDTITNKTKYFPGGPWNSPDHVGGGNNTAMPHGVNEYGIAGNWERTIGLYRTSDVYIVQSRSWLPAQVGGIIWYGAYSATYTIYTPFAAGMELLPDVTLGHHMALNKNSLFWASRYLGNYVQLKWNVIIQEVMEFQNQKMEDNLKLQSYIDKLYGIKDDTALLQLYSNNAIETVQKIWDLCDHLMFKYADGQIHNTVTAYGTSTPVREYDTHGATTKNANVVDKPGYRGDWLESVGYQQGPPPPPDCSKLDWKCGHEPPNVGEEEPAAQAVQTLRKKKLTIDYAQSNEDEREDESTILLWKEYFRKKKVANENGTCGNRGDIAAAIGKCSNNHHNHHSILQQK